MATVHLQNIKIVLCGDQGVGKTHLAWRIDLGFNHGEPFGEVKANDGLNVCYDNFSVTHNSCSVGIWDTSGSGQYDRLRPLSYPCTDVYFVCFSLDDYESYQSIPSRWIPEITHHTPRVPFILVGLKPDARAMAILEGKPRESIISWAQGIDMAKRIQAHSYIEVDTINGVGVRELVDEACAIVCGGCDKKSEGSTSDAKRCIIQ